jgi:hypothetical protein
MATMSEAIRQAAKGRDYLELLTPQGVDLVGFYLAEGEEVGAGDVVEDDRVDFKAFYRDAAQGIKTAHLGGMLVAGLLAGDYSDEAGIAFSERFGLAHDQVARMITWLERKANPRPSVSTGPRSRLSLLAS